MMSKMMSDLIKLHKSFLDKYDDLVKVVPKGTKGDKGDMPTIDYDLIVGRIMKVLPEFIPKAIAGKNADPVDEDSIVEKVVKRLPAPKPEKVKPVDEVKLAARVRSLIPTQEPTPIDHEKLAGLILDGIKKGKMLKMEHIDGLDNSLKVMNSQLAGKIYGKDTWARGGGDTVTAGSGVTITNTSDGTKRISAPGGAATQSTDLSSQCNGTNKVFTIPAFTSIISLIGSDAPIIYRPTTDYTAAGTTLTLGAGVNAPSSGATLILTYV